MHWSVNGMRLKCFFMSWLELKGAELGNYICTISLKFISHETLINDQRLSLPLLFDFMRTNFNSAKRKHLTVKFRPQFIRHSLIRMKTGLLLLLCYFRWFRIISLPFFDLYFDIGKVFHEFYFGMERNENERMNLNGYLYRKNKPKTLISLKSKSKAGEWDSTDFTILRHWGNSILNRREEKVMKMFLRQLSFNFYLQTDAQRKLLTFEGKMKLSTSIFTKPHVDFWTSLTHDFCWNFIKGWELKYEVQSGIKWIYS